MATKTKKVNTDRVAVLRATTGEDFVLRGNPSESDVLDIVKEQNRRYHAGEPGGPSGDAATLIHSAHFYEDEMDRHDPAKASGSVDITHLL